MNKVIRYLNIIILAVIIICGFALYYLPLHHAAFYFDDRSAIINNETIKSLDIPKLFNAFNTRFLVGLSFAINYQVCHLHPFGYRFINLLIHCLNAFLVFLLVKTTLNLLSSKKPILPAIFASLLFLCHPIQTETVNSITQRFVLMGSFFYLLTLFLYIQYRCQSKKPFLLASLLTAIAAMFCKEFVVTLPLMLGLYDFYFLEKRNLRNRLKSLLPFFIIILIVPLLLSRTPQETVRAANIANTNASHQVDISRAKNSISRHDYFLTELNVVRTYVRLLFVPIDQNFDYDYPLSHQINFLTLLSGLFLLCLLSLAVLTYQSQRIISFSILWFFIALSVESSFIPIGHVIAEYRLYLASVGFVFLISSLIFSRHPYPIKLNILALLLLMGVSILTYQRNKIWIDEFSLWNDVVEKSPHKARGYLNRGLEYFQQGKITQAYADFNKSIEINPHYAAAYNDLGVLSASQGNFNEALLDFNKAIEVNPNYTDAYKNRSLTYFKLNQKQRAGLNPALK